MKHAFRPAHFHSVFDMRVCTSHVTQECYDGYMLAMAEPSVVHAQREEAERCAMRCNLLCFLKLKSLVLFCRWQRRLREAQQRVAGVSVDTVIDPYVNHIQENLIQPRCPSCKALVPDFDHCAHLQVRSLVCPVPPAQ